MQHKIGLYIRVSTDEAALRHEGSLDTQRHRLVAFVDMKNMHEAGWGKVIEAYIDDGYSAKDTNRPAFQRMMRDVRKGKINMIFVTDLSRLSRSIRDFCFLLDDLKKASARFLSIKEQFDTTTAAGEMMIFNLMNLAQFERKQTSERVSLNFHARAMRGLRNGGPLNLGYDKDPNNPSSVMVNEKEADDVRTIFSMFLQLGTLGRLATQLNQTMIHPKSLNRKNCRHNMKGVWNPQALHNLLRNPAYVGLREINRGNKGEDQQTLRAFERYQTVKASWPAIIDKETFDDVQKILVTNTDTARARLDAGEERIYLLSGAIRCGECNRALVGSAGHGKKNIHRYYIHRPIHGEKVTCQIKSLRADEIEQEVLKHLDVILTREGHMAQIEGRIIDLARPIKIRLKTEKERRLDELTQIEKEINSAFRLHAELGDGVVDELFKERLRGLQSKKQLIQNRMAEIKDQQESSTDPVEARKTIEENLAEFQKAKKTASRVMLKRLIRKVVAGIVMEPNRVALRYWTGNEALDEAPASETKKASGAIPEASIFNIADHRPGLALPLGPDYGAKAVGGSDVIKNGRGDRI